MRRFQASHGLAVDGVAGPATLGALGHLRSRGRRRRVVRVASGSAAAAAVRSKLGQPYAYGGTGDGGWDCSGLVQWAMAQAGVTVPRTSFDQFGVGTPVDRASIQAGDLVFFNADGPGRVARRDRDQQRHRDLGDDPRRASSTRSAAPTGARTTSARGACDRGGCPARRSRTRSSIRRLRWASEETGFAVIDAERDGDDIVLVGPIAHLEERERVRVRGVWQDDKRFGMQVKVALAEPVAPSGEAALMAYLKRVKHVGGARAARLLERYGDGVLEAIDRDPAGGVPLDRVLAQARQRGDPVVERAALDARRCTCCSRRTGWRGWCRGSPPSTATARTTWCGRGRTS